MELTSPAARPPSLASQLATMREKAARDIEGRVADAKAAPAEAATARDAAKEAETAQRQAAKDQARQRIQTIVEKLRVIKKMAAESPEMMARMLAQLVKELKKAVDAFVAAGGKGGGSWATSLSAPAASPAGEEKSSDIYARMRDEVVGSEAAGDMEFVKNAKDIAKGIREMLDKAKVQLALKQPDDETKKAFEDADETLGDIDKTLDGLDRAIKASSPAAGMFVALYA
jgi:hypothetical protein